MSLPSDPFLRPSPISPSSVGEVGAEKELCKIALENTLKQNPQDQYADRQAITLFIYLFIYLLVFCLF